MRTKHLDRSIHKGEEYVRQCRLDKWINQCVQCQARGYDPDMAEGISGAKHGRNEFVAKYLKKKFPPLPLKDGLCEVCRD